MKRFIVLGLLLVLVGCETEKGYVVTVFENDGKTEKRREFKEKNDSLAYFNAALYFYSMEKTHRQMEEALDNVWTTNFESFKVVNTDGFEIAPNLSEETREQLEVKARNAIYRN
ncbi:hypothetical protein [Litoribacter populi]|uniref:hypothetical protein n=1 Tax=Litoribacter populi TaxID=2598460 RepID=UPI00117C9D81|nr:hypothetical protein [Litoribacter populi]